MWSKKPLLVVLGLLIVVLALLTNKMNTSQSGDHEGERAKRVDKRQPKLWPRYKPLDRKEVTTPSGLKYQEIKVGSGPSPKNGEIVVVKYTGWKTDGRTFDSNDYRGGKPFECPIGQEAVIKGWDEGILTMKVGGKRRLIVPPSLAYGEPGRLPVIEPNATLIFDVELLAIKSRNK